MWIFFKKQNIMIHHERDYMQIQAQESGSTALSSALLCYKDTNEEEHYFDLENPKLFVECFATALAAKRPVWIYDEDQPQFTLRLSGDEKEQNSTAGVDFDSM
jgi:hypothetical protein